MRGEIIRLGLPDGGVTGAPITAIARSLEGPGVEHYVAANAADYHRDHQTTVAAVKNAGLAVVRAARPVGQPMARCTPASQPSVGCGSRFQLPTVRWAGCPVSSSFADRSGHQLLLVTSRAAVISRWLHLHPCVGAATGNNVDAATELNQSTHSQKCAWPWGQWRTPWQRPPTTMRRDMKSTNYDLIESEIPGTEDFRVVIEATAYESYEWAEFRAWYSPSARQFFWSGQSGCSCNMYETPSTIDGMENGSKQDMISAFCVASCRNIDYYYNLEMALAYLDATKQWRYSKEMPLA